MPDYRVSVIVDPSKAVSGSKTAENAISGVGTAADRVASLIKKAFAITGATLGVGALANLADTYTNIQNQIRQTVDSTEELTAVHKRLYDVANDTRAAFDNTVKSYRRLEGSAETLGATSDDVIDVVKLLNQSIAVSGSSADEAGAAIYQLSQALGSGRLGGDELRSVLEQLPYVADLIAKGLNVTRGELKELSEQGKLSAKEVFQALLDARATVEKDFQSTIPTIEQALTVLKNNVLELVGSFDQSVGASQGLASALLGIADNLPTIIKGLELLAFTFGPVLAVNAIGALISAIGSATVSLIAFAALNPFTVLLVAVSGITAAFVLFGDEINALVEQFPIATTAVGLFAAALLTTLAIQALGPVISAITSLISIVKLLSVALLANPLFLIAGVLAAAAAAFLLFGKNVKATEKPTDSFGEAMGTVQSKTEGTNTALGAASEVMKTFGTDTQTTEQDILQMATSANSSATQIQTQMTTAFNTANAAQKTFTSEGISSFATYTNSILSFISTLIAKFNALAAAKAAAGASGSGDGSSAASSATTPGLATGGSITVGGRSGIDRNLLSINGNPVAKVSRGESVNVSNGNGGGSSGGNPVNVTMQIFTPDADSFRRSQSQIASRQQQVISRAARRNS